MKRLPSVLIAIASHGTAQDHYLEMVLAEFRKLSMPNKIVVLSDRNKPVQGAEVVVGLPSRNPYSLPFAHRKVFAENAEGYDLFIYTEDDTFLTGKHIEAFMEVQAKLKDDEILGFVRSETSPEGQKYITSIHHHFRWLPDTVVKRGGEMFAQLSNNHSGCFIATRQQLRKAIASGGFLVEPRSGMYGMLETAASDIYTQCGLRRLLCVSRINDFIVPHLANKYYSQMGIPFEELEAQVNTLSDLSCDSRWNGSLFNPQTKAPDFRWSKNLYEGPDEELLRTLPPSTRNLLSVGASSGVNELLLSKKGIKVCAMPIDPVFADAQRRHGIRTVEGPFESATKDLNGEEFDTILMADVLHLLANPIEWLNKLQSLLEPEGMLIASVWNTSEPIAWLKDWLDGQRRSVTPDYENIGVQPVSPKILRTWCNESGLELTQIIPLVTGSRHIVRRLGYRPFKSLCTTKFIMKAKRNA